jgi:hypothetical protein
MTGGLVGAARLGCISQSKKRPELIEWAFKKEKSDNDSEFTRLKKVLSQVAMRDFSREPISKTFGKWAVFGLQRRNRLTYAIVSFAVELGYHIIIIIIGIIRWIF